MVDGVWSWISDAWKGTACMIRRHWNFDWMPKEFLRAWTGCNWICGIACELDNVLIEQ